MTQQRLIIVDGDLKNRSYIDSGASISNPFKWNLIGLSKFKLVMIQFHLIQIRSQHYLMLPTSTYHYSEHATSNVSPVLSLINEYYAIYNIRDDNTICVPSKEYGEHIQFPRDHKFNLYYMGINEADIDKHYCLDTAKQALEYISIARPTIMDHYKDIHLDIDLLFVNKI